MSLRSGPSRGASVGQETQMSLTRSPSRRHSIQSFFKNNASKLRRSSNARTTRAPSIPSVVEESEPQILDKQKDEGSKDRPRASDDSIAGQFFDGKSRDTRGDSTKTTKLGEIAKLFAGAPVFEAVVGSGGIQGKANDEAAPKLQDHAGLGHAAFFTATLEQQEETQAPMLLDEHVLDIPTTTKPRTAAQIIEDLKEVPNMMGLNGNELGSVGLDYFLQMPFSDSKLTSTEDEHETQRKRRLLLSSPKYLGLVPMNLEHMTYRLGELGEARHSVKSGLHKRQKPNQQKTVEMYADLFTKLLRTPRHHTVADTYSSGLGAQIDALVKILDMSGLWFDFSLVENRIRLGQMLWPSPESDDLDSIDLEEAKDQVSASASERDVVLLQVTLASELLIRLEMSSASITSKKVRWDLVLALRFLENIRVAPKSSTGGGSQYRNSVLSVASFVTACERLEEDTPFDPILYPRQEQQQIDGLLHFAEQIGWPHKAEITKRFHERTRRHSLQTGAFDAYATPPASPKNQDVNFDTPKRPKINRTATAKSVQLLPNSSYGSESFDLGGWLSRSWLSGLVLPGETTSHLLISTLLENSPAAVAVLGDAANLYEGFVYRGRSYWSKSCVLGRVMAAAKGASDCMGWISCDNVGPDQADGWVSLQVKDVVRDSIPFKNDARPVQYDSAFVPEGKWSTLTTADFTWPSDHYLPPSDNTVQYRGFDLISTNTTFGSGLRNEDNSQHTSMSTAVASLDFAIRDRDRPVTIPVIHDVYFISAALCSTTTSSSSMAPPDSIPPPCHPLHSSYCTKPISAASILAHDFTDTVQLGDETVVMDCRGEGELDLLARAWCAKVGESAVVGRVGKSCISCCVREARAAGVKIVLRV